MPREMRYAAGGRCRRQVWRRETSRGAEDASEGGRSIGRRRRRRKAEEAEAEFKMERRGGRGFPLHHPDTKNATPGPRSSRLGCPFTLYHPLPLTLYHPRRDEHNPGVVFFASGVSDTAPPFPMPLPLVSMMRCYMF